jgi:vacuolar protein sorting-associated protein 52
VSADIEHLQARSTRLNVRLENRKAVEKGLGPVVEELSVSPAVVSEIAEGHVDESWARMLAEVEKRSEAVARSSRLQQGQSRALADMAPLLEKLTLKVCMDGMDINFFFLLLLSWCLSPLSARAREGSARLKMTC